MNTLKAHWPEYLMEAGGLGAFMVSACTFGALLAYPGWPLSRLVADGIGRRALMGLAMGLTLVAIVYSPWGKQSGAHLNPSFTLTFLRLGKIQPPDAVFYVIAQFAGGLAGVLLCRAVLGGALADPAVNYVVTIPGEGGPAVAFAAEAAIAFILMLTVLGVSNSGQARWTGLAAGALVASYVTFESPLSGMSLNPARSLGSAVPAMTWTALWVYFTAPLLGMMAAAEVYTALRGARAVHCAKLHHENRRRCIFCQTRPAQGQA